MRQETEDMREVVSGAGVPGASRLTFRKRERLHSHTLVDDLFARSSSAVSSTKNTSAAGAKENAAAASENAAARAKGNAASGVEIATTGAKDITAAASENAAAGAKGTFTSASENAAAGAKENAAAVEVRGGGISEYPLRLVWRAYSEEELAALFPHGVPAHIAPIQMMVTIPKRKHKHAVDRVRLRRRVREAYRLNRLPLLHSVSACPETRLLTMAFIFLSSDDVPYAKIEKSMHRLFEKISKTLYPQYEHHEESALTIADSAD